MLKVGTLGEILVEIMADERGRGFREPLRLVGPFPSGAPAIFIDQVAKLGQPCGIIACVGDDDFGRVNLERLEEDGVDVTAVEVHPTYVTGSAFVRYRDDGDRDFVFNIKNSACGQLRLTDAGLELLRECRHLHVSGASLSSPQMVEMVTTAIELVKSSGGSVSFDPNIRKEVVRDPQVRAALEAVLASCDTFLPSGEELTLLTKATDATRGRRRDPGNGSLRHRGEERCSGRDLLRRQWKPERAGVPGGGGGPDGRRRLFRRHLRHVPSPGPRRGREPRLRERRRGPGGDHPGPDGRHLELRRARRPEVGRPCRTCCGP